MGRFFLLVLILVSSSCFSWNFSAHEYFKTTVSGNVGRRISDPHTGWVGEDRYESARALENGNMEYKYHYVRRCFYFFEVEKNTEVIVGWRFEGSGKDCALNPT